MNGPVLDLRPVEPVAFGRPLAAEIVEYGWLEAHAAAWDRLVADAAYPNPIFSRRTIAAHVDHGLSPQGLRFLVVRDGGELRALLPYHPNAARVGYFGRAAAPLRSPYVPNATPLVATKDFAPAIDALVGGLPLAAEGLWRLPMFAMESTVGTGMRAAIGARGWASAVAASFERAVLECRPSYEDFGRTLRGRGKDLRRRRRRLAEAGGVEHRSVVAGPGLAEAIDAFLELERHGWKGARGTALACKPNTRAFAHALFGDHGGPVVPRADLLLLAGRPIAASLALVCRGTAVLMKTAYDESLRPFAPGLLLEDEIVRAAHETRFAQKLDSASLPGSVLDGLYPDRETIADLLVAPGLTTDQLAAIASRERRREAAMSALKSLLSRFGRR